MSRRSAEAVVSWRYAVLESDEAEPAEWLRCLVQMPLRITSICESGKRSIHALVRVDAASKADWDKLMGPIKPVLITLGADTRSVDRHPVDEVATGHARRTPPAAALFESAAKWRADYGTASAISTLQPKRGRKRS